MVDTSVLEADVARRESSSLSWGTKLKHITHALVAELVDAADSKSAP